MKVYTSMATPLPGGGAFASAFNKAITDAPEWNKSSLSQDVSRLSEAVCGIAEELILLLPEDQRQKYRDELRAAREATI